MREYPHLGRTRDASAYEGDWKWLIRDDNRQNRSVVFDYRFRRQGSADRICSERFSVREFCFSLLVFPRGNPAHPGVSHGIAVYLRYHSEKECRCAFKIRLVAPQRRGQKSRTWDARHKQMNRYHASTWGVHTLLPVEDTDLMVHEDGSLRLEVELILTYVTMEIVVPRGRCISVEVFPFTTLEDLILSIVGDNHDNNISGLTKITKKSTGSVCIWTITKTGRPCVLRRVMFQEPLGNIFTLDMNLSVKDKYSAHIRLMI